ncbi:MAG TPA: glycosyltransferase family 9 protein [Roseiarcus sp.]|nr:glycosyltransferase family 9 protein [Roseiarcus sp.]
MSTIGAIGSGDDLDPAAAAPADNVALERAAVAKAEQALENKEYLKAARFYAEAAELAPSRIDYRMMCGHCLKDGREFQGAFDAYMSALSAASSGDAYVQLGHLFKLTGNLNEEERAYREGERLGEAAALVEIANLAGASVAQLALFAAPPQQDDLPADLFWEVMLCGRGETLDHGAITNAGKSLALCGFSDVAKAFFEVAYLAYDEEAFRSEHFTLVQRTGLWPATHLSELVRASLSRSGRGSTSVRSRLQGMIVRMAEVRLSEHEPPLLAPPEPFPDWPPKVLGRDECEGLLKGLSDAIDRTYRAFSAETPISGAEIIEGVQGLQQAALASDHVVTFPASASSADLRLVATGVLNSLVRRWLRSHRRRFLGPYIRPEQVAADLAVGGNPLGDLAMELRSAAAVFDEVARLLPRAAGPSSLSLDRFFYPLAATGASALSPDQLDDFLQEAIRRELPNSIAVLAWSFVAAGASSGRIIHYAQKLKSAGRAAFAYDFMNRGLNEDCATKEYLVEKALLAKINGDFRNAARLFEKLAADDPKNSFFRRELAAILPEIEPIASILDRFQADRSFLEIARERSYYRDALGDEGVNFDEAFCDEGVRIFDLAPEIALDFAPRNERTPREEIQILDVGRARRRGLKGELIVLHACDFVRVRVQSLREIVGMRARIDGKTVGVATPVALSSSEPFEAIRGWMVNCWMDLSEVAPGAHELQLYFEEHGGGYRSRELSVWVDPSPATPEADESASIFDLPPDSEDATVDERVNRMPTVVLSAERNIFQGEFKNVLVVRADQLGDVTLSLPAMFVLRDLFSDAKLTCLAAPANRELLLSTGLFSEVLSVEMIHDVAARRRFTTLAEQLRLRKALQPMSFDLAIDLSPGGDARPLLRLAGARYTAGFSPGDFPWLTFGINLQTRDVGNGREGSPHSVNPMALVVALAAVMRHVPFRLPSPNADRSLLRGFGLDAARPFATLHSGARTASRKWPLANYLALAQRLISERGLQVALLVDARAELDDVEAAVLTSPDLHVVAQRLSFPQFDALLSRCALFVGNDTGPKHLASTRGVPVVSLHMGAVNWREWGQETGLIVTRRTPCYGCGIEQIEDCGKGLPCLLNISVDDVFGAVERALAMGKQANLRVDDAETPLLHEVEVDAGY